MEAFKQTEIDFDRRSQHMAWRAAALEPRQSADGKTVSAPIQKLVLKAIDDHAGGHEAWLSFETLAEECCLSVRTMKRAVEVLIDASLICVERKRSPRGVVCNHYRIVWSELALCARGRGPAIPASLPPTPNTPSSATYENGNHRAPVSEHSALGTDQSAPALEHSALGADHRALEGTLNVLNVIKRNLKKPPPPTPSSSADADECEMAAAAGEVVSDPATALQLVSVAKARRESPQEFRVELRRLAAIASSPANLPRWKKSLGGVVAYRYLTQAWPADGVVEQVDQLAASTELAAAAQAKRAAETLDREISVAVMEGRRRRLSEDQIKLVLRKMWTDEVLVTRGW